MVSEIKYLAFNGTTGLGDQVPKDVVVLQDPDQLRLQAASLGLDELMNVLFYATQRDPNIVLQFGAAPSGPLAKV